MGKIETAQVIQIKNLENKTIDNHYAYLQVCNVSL